MKERILDKLGMTRTNFEVDSLAAYEDTSKGYLFAGTDQMEVGYMRLKTLSPAGAIVSCAADMALFQLGDGTWKGERLISRENLDMMLPLMGAILPVRFLSGADGHIAALEAALEPTPGIAPVVFAKE